MNIITFLYGLKRELDRAFGNYKDYQSQVGWNSLQVQIINDDNTITSASIRVIGYDDGSNRYDINISINNGVGTVFYPLVMNEYGELIK